MASSVVEDIIRAASLFERLQLPLKTTERDVIKKQFRQLAVQVHPDKCTSPSAKDAFQLLAEAFEILSDPIQQEQELRRVETARRRSAKRARTVPVVASNWGSWWQVSWTVFEKRLEERERLETQLREEFMKHQASRFSNQRVRRDLRQAEATVRTFDETAGIDMHRLWPLAARQEAEANKTTEEPTAKTFHLVRELTDEEARDRLADLVFYLRQTYFYCLFCGTTYENSEDLESCCPGPFYWDH